MANSAPVRKGYTALMQEVLHDQFVDFLQTQFPLVALIMAKDPQDAVIGKRSFATKPLSGGRLSRIPGFLAGKRLMPVDRARIAKSEIFEPLIQTGLPTDNGKTMGVSDTLPEKTDWDTDTPMSRFTRPYTKWFDRMWPISVPRWETLLAQGGGEAGAAAALVDITAKEARDTVRMAIQYYNTSFWTTATAPSDQEARKWDNTFSIYNICGTANRYMGIDRSLAENAYFRGKLDTTSHSENLKALIDDYKYTGAKVAQYGYEQDDVFVFCNPHLFTKFRDEAKSNGAMQIDGASSDFAKFGFKYDIVLYEPGVWVVNDFSCPTHTVAFLRPDTFYVAFHPADNWRVEPFKYQGVPGSNDALESFLRVNMMMGCVAPCINAYYTDVSA